MRRSTMKGFLLALVMGLVMCLSLPAMAGGGGYGAFCMPELMASVDANPVDVNVDIMCYAKSDTERSFTIGTTSRAPTLPPAASILATLGEVDHPLKGPQGAVLVTSSSWTDMWDFTTATFKSLEVGWLASSQSC